MKYWLGKFAFLPTIVEATAKIPRLFLSNIKTVSSVRWFFRREKLNETENNKTEALRMQRARISATNNSEIIQLFISSMSQHRVNLSRHSHANLIYLIYFSIILAQCISQHR